MRGVFFAWDGVCSARIRSLRRARLLPIDASALLFPALSLFPSFPLVSPLCSFFSLFFFRFGFRAICKRRRARPSMFAVLSFFRLRRLPSVRLSSPLRLALCCPRRLGHAALPLRSGRPNAVHPPPFLAQARPFARSANGATRGRAFARTAGCARAFRPFVAFFGGLSGAFWAPRPRFGNKFSGQKGLRV